MKVLSLFLPVCSIDRTNRPGMLSVTYHNVANQLRCHVFPDPVMFKTKIIFIVVSSVVSLTRFKLRLRILACDWLNLARDVSPMAK